MQESPSLIPQSQMTQDQSAVDYFKLSREILVLLRGDLSQSDLSQKLGFTFNQVGKWESGATLIHWQDFIKVCKALEIPWGKHFKDSFIFCSSDLSPEMHIFEVLSQFFGFANISEMAQRLNKSRSSVSRILHNQVKISLEDVLRVMDLRKFVLCSWLSRFLDPINLHAVQKKYKYEITVFNSLTSLPWASLVNACLHLKPYKELGSHSTEWIAGKTGLTVSQVNQALDHLQNTELIMKVENHYLSLIREFTAMKMPSFRKITHFLNQTVADMYNPEKSYTQNIENPSLSSVRVYPISSQAAKEIATTQIRFHHQVSEIIKNDAYPPDHVRVVLMHSLDMGLQQTLGISQNER